MSRRPGSGGREGVTTGSCAAAAAKAAALALCLGERPDVVSISCPPTPHAHPGRLSIPLACIRQEGQAVRAEVLKNAGDDPDITHGCAIQAVVWIDPALPPGDVILDGGEGVGRVTLPGLPVPVGRAAINPAPLAQIHAAVQEVLARLPAPPGLQVRIEAPEGRRLAERTLNPRLGVVGGISILGTRGTVKPFSHGSWKETIRRQLDVLANAGGGHVVLSTGGQSEHLCRLALPALPATAFVQAGDFAAFALRQAARHGMQGVTLGLYFGKCCKLAQGIGFTHARAGALDLTPLVRWAQTAGLDRAAAALAQARTARHAVELLTHGDAGGSPSQGEAALHLTARRALAWAERMAGCTPQGRPVPVTLLLFDTTNALRLQRSSQDG
ncbi:cobalt-precorrin-5B (C(1))-methyltransferase CbiD [Megalodesulfovibrio gigas]|uniref:Cobalt-precorrin-5B C(1)-methyltransferase n=1 Tax=Megalodesulfovibrio gigas (strain ATCC 19364 / DSM 1382 / NCIMB 9332 / VKM B-1759) TaxID=1121448 RepID=T2G794_MEGG1|nr:cobalt-precorrin-5B (C(1))-methyltransferase CbiD [Megalodesulfovibrio gigas]AGW12470.1 putative cobalamin biosynthesis protein CbiD [Megalodesulfovibrio gigas DSM 1382 = ATCC 19364]